MTNAEIINRFVASIDNTVRPQYLSVMARFDYWAIDGLPTSTYGASQPGSQQGAVKEDPDSDVELTSVERLAFRVDQARVKQQRVRSMATSTAFVAAGVVQVVDGVAVFKHLDTDAQRVAVLVWCAKRLQTLDSIDVKRLPTKRLQRLLSATEDLVDALLDAAEPVENTSTAMTCSNHRRAGFIESVDPSRFRAGLCRWCSDFKGRHGVEPPLPLVKLHDRGVRVTHTMILRVGVHV